MLAIRLTRIGKKNSPAYRVVVADKKRAVKRKFIEILGHYNPILQPKQLEINKDRAGFWLGRGAQPSDTVRNLMVDLGILDKKINKIYAKKSESAEKAGPVVDKSPELVPETKQPEEVVDQESAENQAEVTEAKVE